MDDCHGVHSATDRYLTHVQYVVDQLRAGKLTSDGAITLHSVHSTDLLVACTDAFIDRLHEVTRPAIAPARAKARRAGECRHPDGPGRQLPRVLGLRVRLPAPLAPGGGAVQLRVRRLRLCGHRGRAGDGLMAARWKDARDDGPVMGGPGNPLRTCMW